MKPWLIERSAELSELCVGADSRTPCDRWKERKASQDTMGFGERVHYKIDLKGKASDEHLEARRWSVAMGGPRGLRPSNMMTSHRSCDAEGGRPAVGLELGRGSSL